MTLVIFQSATPYAGNDIKLVCYIQLSGTLTTNEVSVSVRCLKYGIQYREVSTPSGSGDTLQSILVFTPLVSSDSGIYSCEVTLTANQRTSPVKKTSPPLTLTVHSEY